MSRQLSVALAFSSYCDDSYAVNRWNNKPTTSFHVELRHVEGNKKDGFDEDKKMSIEVMGAPYFRILCINMHEGLGVIACFRYCFFLLLAFLLTLNNPPAVSSSTTSTTRHLSNTPEKSRNTNFTSTKKYYFTSFFKSKTSSLTTRTSCLHLRTKKSTSSHHAFSVRLLECFLG